MGEWQTWDDLMLSGGIDAVGTAWTGRGRRRSVVLRTTGIEVGGEGGGTGGDGGVDAFYAF